MKNEHPGWSIKFSDGTWLAHAHGFYKDECSSLASVFSTLEYAQCICEEEKFSDYEIVVAWEPLCGQLRHKVSELTKANKINPKDIFRLQMDIESILSTVQSWDKDK